MIAYLVDCSGLIYRSYFKSTSGDNPDQSGFGAVAEFCWRLSDIRRGKVSQSIRLAPCTHAVAVFDRKGRSWRKEAFPGYKAKRPPPPESLIIQQPYFREAAKAFGFHVVERDVFEADDVIATYAMQVASATGHSYVFSHDKDMLQTVSDRTSVVDGAQVVGPAAVSSVFGVPAALVTDVQGLAGDATDGIPGAPGVGMKKAADLVQRFGSLDAVLRQAEEISTPKLRETLQRSDVADIVRLSKELATLVDDVPGIPHISSLEAFHRPLEAIEFCKKIGSDSLARWLMTA
jgi:DNA polymerase I